MRRASYILERARSGYQGGHGELIDSMIKDGLWDAYGNVPMGACAELCASKYQFSREEQDTFSVQSYTRALKARQEGWFRDEIIEGEGAGKPKPLVIRDDERLTRLDEAKMRRLSPASTPDGTDAAGRA